MKVATSILTADFNNLKKEIKSLDKSDYLHLDVMDGHFVPNISFGYAVLSGLPKITNIPLDIHLMISNPYEYIESFAKLKPEFITIHVEANKPYETIKKIKEMGIKSGLSLKPHTSLNEITQYLNLVDLVLVMTVEPGFGGQSFLESQMDKVKKLHELRIDNNYNYVIQIDGGINDKTIKHVTNTGCDIVVSGSYILNAKSRDEAIKSLK